MSRFILALASLLYVITAKADPFAGSYIGNFQGASFHLNIERNDDYGYHGSMLTAGQQYELYAERETYRLLGEINTATGEIPFMAMQQGEGLLLSFSDGTSVMYERVSEIQQSIPSIYSESTGNDMLTSPSGQTREVYVNRRLIPEQELLQTEIQLGAPIQSGRYWYDNLSGGWGMEGGPTAGILPAGLGLSIEMPANISGGGTEIFFNGRELHPIDHQRLLAAYGVAMPGRYWVDGQGYIGLEGGPVFGNLYAALKQKQNSDGSFSSKYGFGNKYGVMVKDHKGGYMDYYPGQ